MADTWAQDLRRVLVEAGRHVVEQARRQAQRPVDAFCVVVDSGSCWFAWDQAPARWRSGDPLPPRDGRMPGDFSQPHADVPADLEDSLVDAGDTYAARFEAAELDGCGHHAEEQLDAAIEAAAAAALVELGPDLERLARTDGFVAHVVRFDGRWPEESVRRTVPHALVSRRFPGFAAQHARDVALGELSSARGPRALVARLADAYAVPADARIDVHLVEAVDRELRGHAEAAVGPVMDALEWHARQPQFTSSTSDACRHLGAWTRAHRLTAHLLLQVLPCLSGVEGAAVERRLIELGRWLHDNREWCEDHGSTIVGLNESLVARTLHQLWPDRHPRVEVSHTTNEVLNASRYGFTRSEQA